MIKNNPDALIDFLNSLVEIDRYAITELLCARVLCNQQMADHPSVQVSSSGAHRVGILGILNGFCGTIDEGPKKGWGPITAIYERGALIRFERSETNAGSPALQEGDYA